jgi:hypothetical protein
MVEVIYARRVGGTTVVTDGCMLRGMPIALVAKGSIPVVPCCGLARSVRRRW